MVARAMLLIDSSEQYPAIPDGFGIILPVPDRGHPLSATISTTRDGPTRTAVLEARAWPGLAILPAGTRLGRIGTRWRGSRPLYGPWKPGRTSIQWLRADLDLTQPVLGCPHTGSECPLCRQ